MLIQLTAHKIEDEPSATLYFDKLDIDTSLMYSALGLKDYFLYAEDPYDLSFLIDKKRIKKAIKILTSMDASKCIEQDSIPSYVEFFTHVLRLSYPQVVVTFGKVPVDK